MKKLFFLFLLLLFPIKVNAISARNMVAIDMDTNRVLFEKSAYDEHLIASISNIMTT